MVKVDIRVPISYKTEDVKDAIIGTLPIERCEISEIRIIKRALNVSDKSDIHYKMTVGVSLSPEREAGLLKMRKKVFPYEECTLEVTPSHLTCRPVVVGCGPCGLFASLILAEAGARPILLERGLSVEKRREKVELFSRLGVLDPECNIQFGEGGAGTYSDGKLKCGAYDKYKMRVLKEFIDAGANPEIAYSVGAHLGTDKLSGIIKKIREKIIALGGEFIFSARLVDVKTKHGRVVAAVYEKDGAKCEIDTDNIILATGHSARDTYELLQRLSLPMESRGFGIGVRIEHPREYINKLVYGENYPSELESASYRLVTHLADGRSVYSFCMCPGGSVVAAASEEGGVVTNGMSEHARMGENSNAAFLVSVNPKDFESEGALAGFDLQRKIERAAYSLTNSYKAPVTTLSDFKNKKAPNGLGNVSPTYKNGVELFEPEKYLPSYITDSLRAAISDFDRWMCGFDYSDAVLTGPETRSTSPVRILRDENYESLLIKGLYPAGEGAGYSGGIVSSAVDGIKCAEAILQKVN